jgi:hypothetical protein
VRLLTGNTVEDPAENLHSIGRGEFAKARSEEPWNWSSEFCLAVPVIGTGVCAYESGHQGKHSWAPGIRPVTLF